jgi:formamidopyrimidine-DNA glycosylase
MPELPEVETMVRGLRPVLEGSVVNRIEVLDPALLGNCTAEHLSRQTEGATVTAVARRGKWVVLSLSGSGGIIVIQPRMTGGFWTRVPDRPDHIRLIFRMSGPAGDVWFCDTRRLGKIAWYPDPAVAGAAFERSHGPDALKIGQDELASRLAGTQRGIKPTLLDQKVLAGIGNIYADEILFQARLHPERPAAWLSKREVQRLHQAIGPILSRAIALEGSTFDGSYRTLLGQEGGYLKQSLVHRRQGRPCRECGGPIVKARIAGLVGRPTYYCPNCQRKGGAPRGRSGRGRGDRVS